MRIEDVIWAASLRFSEVEHGDWIVHGVNMNRSPKIAICARKEDAEFIAKSLNLVRNLRSLLDARDMVQVLETVRGEA